MCEQYNGWTNRETWALHLYLWNDQGLYEMTRSQVAWAKKCHDESTSQGDFPAYRAGEVVSDFWDELTDPDAGLMTATAILSMVTDVGSVYRVDWDEIGAAWLEGIDE